MTPLVGASVEVLANASTFLDARSLRQPVWGFTCVFRVTAVKNSQSEIVLSDQQRPFG